MGIFELSFGLFCLISLFCTYQYLRLPAFSSDNSRRGTRRIKSLVYFGLMLIFYLAIPYVVLYIGASLSGISNEEFIPYKSILVWFSTIQLIVYLIKYITRIVEEVRTQKTIIELMISMVLVMLISNVFFGGLYRFITVESFGGELSVIEGVYFAFAINYSISLQTEIYTSLQMHINQETSLMLLQMVHITISKISELLVLGLIVTKVLNMISLQKNQENNQGNV